MLYKFNILIEITNAIDNVCVDENNNILTNTK